MMNNVFGWLSTRLHSISSLISSLPHNYRIGSRSRRALRVNRRSLRVSNERNERIPPPHSHLHRHSQSISSHALLLGSYNWSLNDSNRQSPTHSTTHSTTHSPTHLNDMSSCSMSYRDKDRNVLAAMMSIIVIATLATALAQPKWFSISGGICNRRYIGLQEFFYPGMFNAYSDKGVNKLELSLNISESQSHVKSITYSNVKQCITEEVVTLQRTIIALCFFAIMFNLIQFFMDTMGTNRKWINSIRQHALGNILGVLFCVIIIGVSYLVTNLLEKEQQKLVKQSHDSQLSQHIEVKFEISYYLVTLSGLLAIIAAACNLLKRPYSTSHYFEPNIPYWTEHIDPNSTQFDDDISLSSPNTSPNRINATPISLSLSLQPQTSLMYPTMPPPYS